MNERIKLEMNGKDMLVAMAGGNPGALTVCLKTMQNESQIDPDSFLGGIGAILSMDTLGIYEHRIWMLYKDVCGQDLIKMLGILRANQLGFLSASILNSAIDNRGDGVDVDDMLKKVQERLPRFGQAAAITD